MKAILFVCLIASFASADDGNVVNEVFKGIIGFFEGMNDKHEFDNIITCVDQVNDVTLRVQEIIEQVKNIDWSKIELVFNFLEDLLDSLKEIFESLEPCGSSISEFKKLFAIIAKFDVNKLVKYVEGNILFLIMNANEAVKKIQQKDYEEFGKYTGKIIYEIIINCQKT